MGYGRVKKYGWRFEVSVVEVKCTGSIGMD